MIAAKAGDFVKRGELLATLFADDESRLYGAESRYLSAVSIGDKKACGAADDTRLYRLTFRLTSAFYHVII